MEDIQLQDSIFEKIMPILDEYQLCKLKLLQLKQSGANLPTVKIDLQKRKQAAADEIKTIITQDAENQ